MFTGLIEEMGQIRSIKNFNGGIELCIEADLVMDDLAIDHSIAVNGVCQTVISLDERSFRIQAIKETLDKTTFSDLRTGDKVNLERAMKAHDRLGGHFVQGHVNGTATLKSVEHRGENKLVGVALPPELAMYCILEGSITIDGISLTIADLQENDIFLSIIPHTWNVTNLSKKAIGDAVNIEVDMMAKYIYQFMEKMKR